MASTYDSERFEQAVPIAPAEERAGFILRTYSHLFGALSGFVLLEILFFTTGVADRLAAAMLSVSWLWILGAFVVVGWLASRAAHTVESLPLQYLALAGFVVAQALIFLPMLYVAQAYAPGAIESAAAVTFAGFVGLTAVAFLTRKDFSFLRGLMLWGGIVALVAIGAGAIFGFELGTWFSVAMIAFAGAAILYDTSNILHHYPSDRYVAAALELFASVALMLWYVLRLFMSRD